jgi:hypothetical protein
MGIKQIDIEKIALAIEADAGEKLTGLRESLELSTLCRHFVES